MCVGVGVGVYGRVNAGAVRDAPAAGALGKVRALPRQPAAWRVVALVELGRLPAVARVVG